MQHHIFSNGSGSMYVAKSPSRGSNQTKKKDNNEKHIFIFFDRGNKPFTRRYKWYPMQQSLSMMMSLP